MSYEFHPLRGKVGLTTDVDVLQFTTGLQVSEMSTFNLVFRVDAVSAGIGALNPAIINVEQSWDGGTTWEVVPGITAQPITAAGLFRAYVTNTTGLMAPNLRTYLTVPAAEAVVLGEVTRAHVSPRDSVAFQPPQGAGGAATEATLLQIYGAVDGLEGMVDGLEVLVGTTNSTLTAMELLATTLNGYVDQLEGYTDGIETLVGATNVALASVEGALTTLNATDFATEAKQDVLISGLVSVDSHVDGIEGQLTTIDSHVDGIEGQLTTIAGHIDGIEGELTTLNAKDFATETTAQLLRKWPYATFDSQAFTAAALTDTWEYKSGAAVVGTVLITYTDVTKAVVATVGYTPAKVV